MSVALRHSTSQRLAFNLCPACLRMLRVPVTHPRFTQSTHPLGSSVPLSLQGAHRGMLVVQDIYPVSCGTVTTSSTILSLVPLRHHQGRADNPATKSQDKYCPLVWSACPCYYSLRPVGGRVHQLASDHWPALRVARAGCLGNRDKRTGSALTTNTSNCVCARVRGRYEILR